MAISLQRSGLTGRRMMNPPSPGKSILGMRQVSAPAAAPTEGPAPSVTPESGPKPGLSGDNAAARALGYTSDVPNEVPDSGLTYDDVKGPLATAGMLTGSAVLGGAPLGPAFLGAVANTAFGTAVGKGVKWGFNKAKNALGYGPEKDAPASGLPTHGPSQSLDVPSYDTKDYDWSKSGDIQGSTKGDVHGPSQSISPSESFDTKDFDYDSGWLGGPSDDDDTPVG